MHNKAITRSQGAVRQIYKLVFIYVVAKAEIYLNLLNSKDSFKGKLGSNPVFSLETKKKIKRPNLVSLCDIKKTSSKKWILSIVFQWSPKRKIIKKVQEIIFNQLASKELK